MIFALDTSTAVMSLALVKSDNVIAESKIRAHRNHSVMLVPEMNRLFAEAGVENPESAIEVIAAGQGPGSYTGVRIGVAAAKTLAWSWGLPVIGVSSLETMAKGAHSCTAENKGSGDVWFAPLIDARRGNAYSALFASGANGWRRLMEDRKRPVREWLRELEPLIRRQQPSKLVFCGEVRPFGEPLSDCRMRMGDTIAVKEADIQARFAAFLARDRQDRLCGESIHAFVPNYTQLAEVESKFLTREK